MATIGRGSFLSLEFEENLFVEAEGLFPALDFVAGLLSGGFVCAKIKNQEGLRHEDGIAGGGRACQGEGRKQAEGAKEAED